MTRLSDDVIAPEQSSVLRIEHGAAATSKKKKSFLKISTITNKRGRHANLGCHGEEGVSFWGCLFTRKLLQHHGNDPVPFPLQQADRQVHSFSHILSKQGLVWFTECFIFLFWEASQGHFLSEDCESLRRRKQNRSRKHVGPDTSWTTQMIYSNDHRRTKKRMISFHLRVNMKHCVRHWDYQCFLTDPFDSEWRIHSTKVQSDRTWWVLIDGLWISLTTLCVLHCSDLNFEVRSLTTCHWNVQR